MFPCSAMRSMPHAFRLATFAAAAFAVLFVQACKKSESAAPSSDGGIDAAPLAAMDAAEPETTPDAAAADAAPANVTHAAVHPVGPPAVGNGCNPKDPKEARACAPGGFEELACMGGVWKVAQVCRGPGACKTDAAGVHCDPGPPAAGDPCAEPAAPRCASVHQVFMCKAGLWESSMCVPPGKCVPNAKNGVAGCK
jgi:hypothetical protein